jgi:hypothetical protein
MNPVMASDYMTIVGYAVVTLVLLGLFPKVVSRFFIMMFEQYHWVMKKYRDLFPHHATIEERAHKLVDLMKAELVGQPVIGPLKWSGRVNDALADLVQSVENNTSLAEARQSAKVLNGELQQGAEVVPVGEIGQVEYHKE